MKTKFLFAIAFALTTVAFAQKKEVKAIEKAVKSGNFAAAKAAVPAAEALMSAMDQKTKEKFLLVKAQAFLGDNTGSASDLETAAKTFEMLKGTKYDGDAQSGLQKIIAATVNGAIADIVGDDVHVTVSLIYRADGFVLHTRVGMVFRGMRSCRHRHCCRQ